MDNAKREHLKSDRQWEETQKTMRPLNFPKAKQVETNSSSNTNSNPDNPCADLPLGNTPGLVLLFVTKSLA